MLARKLRRDLWRLRGQIVAVALVAAAGVANLVMSQATLDSLQASRARFYREYAFADAFATVKRAPEGVARRLAGIEGVAQVDTRISSYGRAAVADYPEPVRVQALSLPESGAPRMNRLHLRAGRLPEAGERNAIAISDAFAEAHRLRPGQSLALVLHGKRQRFRIVGIATSPEFVAQLDPVSVFPDARRFAIVWMSRRALAAATDMDGAFNSASLSLRPGAQLQRTLTAVDAVLEAYGGTGAIGRVDQRSNRYLDEEFRQLRTMTRIFPAIFLSVSAFVLYVVLGRLIAGQREQIGTLKAFGYRSVEVWRHYAGFALATGVLGAVLGIAAGAWLGDSMAELYARFYRLPYLDFSMPASVIVLALLVSVGSALIGAAIPAWKAARLAPADAMRAEIPRVRVRAPRRAKAGLERLAQAHLLILRNLQRRPIRSLLTLLGLAAGTAVMMIGRFQSDAIDDIVGRQFRQAERHDISVAFVEPVSPRVLHELSALPGVRRVEAERTLPVRIRYRSASYVTIVRGLAPGAQLRRTLDRKGQPVAAPIGGVTLTAYLAEMLGAELGDRIELEALDGRRRTLSLPLAGLLDEPFGAQAYLPASVLGRAFGDGERVNGAILTADSREWGRLVTALDRRPGVAGVDQRLLGIRNFYDGMANTVLVFTLIATAFGMVITGGVVYSSARVALSERARDLASLRILGFSTAEVGYLLLGELALLAVLAVPLGFALGHGMIALLVMGFESDLFRIPHHVSAATYGIAGTTSLATALACAVSVRRQVGQLDLIGVLKARD